LVVHPYCAFCKPLSGFVLRAEVSRPENCRLCGKNTLSGVYATDD